MDSLYILLGGIVFIAVFFLLLSIFLERKEKHTHGIVYYQERKKKHSH